jgi:hypothetical protein
MRAHLQEHVLAHRRREIDSSPRIGSASTVIVALLLAMVHPMTRSAMTRSAMIHAAMIHAAMIHAAHSAMTHAAFILLPMAHMLVHFLHMLVHFLNMVVTAALLGDAGEGDERDRGSGDERDARSARELDTECHFISSLLSFLFPAWSSCDAPKAIERLKQSAGFAP